MASTVPSKDLPPLTAPFFPNTFVKNQFCSKPPPLPKGTNLTGKVAIITGANVGLGLECARQLLSLSLSRLVLAVRSSEKGAAAAKTLRAAHPEATIDVWALDMCSYQSIQSFAARVQKDLTRLDIAVLNAGVGALEFETVPSTGHEAAVQVNYISTVLLAILLLPALKTKSPRGVPGRLTIVNAALSHVAKFANRESSPLLKSFDDPATFDRVDRYNTSKLLAHFFLYKLVDWVSAEDVVVNLADPGFVKGTDLSRKLTGVAAAGLKVFSALTARSLQVGGSTYVDACVAKGKESHGCFLMSWQIQPFASMLYTIEGRQVANALWEETMAELRFAEVEDILSSMKEK